MKTRPTVIVLALPFLFAAAGCKKDEGSAGETAAPTCSDKALKHANPSFCVDLPAGYEASPEKKTITGTTQITVTRKSDKEEFVVDWGNKNETADSAIKATKSPDPGEKITEQGALPGGGYFVKTLSNNATTSNKDYFIVYAVAKGSKAFVHCFGMNAKPDFIADVVKVCKALHVD